MEASFSLIPGKYRVRVTSSSFQNMAAMNKAATEDSIL